MALRRRPRGHTPAPRAVRWPRRLVIRTQEDAGIVAILDRRVHAKGYGKTLLKSLPPAQRTDDLEVTRRFAANLPRGPEVQPGVPFSS